MTRRNSTTTTTTTATATPDTTTTTEDTMTTTATATPAETPEVETIETAPAVDNTGLVWEEPPAAIAAPKRQRGAKRAAVVEGLKANPGKWAKVKENLKYTTECTEWRKLGCEVKSGKPEGSDLYSIWARWPEAN